MIMKKTNIHDVLISIQNEIGKCKEGTDNFKRTSLENIYIKTLEKINWETTSNEDLETDQAIEESNL